MPIAVMSFAVAPIIFIASTATPSWLAQISSASCSTQPGCGKYCVNSRCAMLRISPFSLNRMQRLLVVPASSAIIYFVMVCLLLFHFRWLYNRSFLMYWYFNTSRVSINQTWSVTIEQQRTDFNTSHVSINLLKNADYTRSICHFNTSHVSINLYKALCNINI